MMDRVPPQNLEAEASVLGGVLLRNDTLSKVIERGVTAEDFFHPGHRAVFEAMVELDQAGKPIDVVTLSEQLKRAGTLARIPGAEAFLADLAARVPTAENVGYYAGIVREKASLRRLIAACGDITSAAFVPGADAGSLLDQAEGRIYGLAQASARRSYQPVKTLAVEAYQGIEEQHKRGIETTGVPTGFVDLDRLTCGLQPSDLVILAARPSVGKTALALNIAHNAAEKGVPALIFSLEMSREQLTRRLICTESGVDGTRLRSGQLEHADWPRLSGGVARVSALPIYIDDDSSPTVLEIRAKARRWRRDPGIFKSDEEPGLIVVDYLQLIRGSASSDASREREVSAVSRGLKALAKDLRAPVLALSQLNRRLESREDKRPMLSDLRESGSLEQDADVVLFIHRESRKDGEDDNTAKVIIGKQRNGPVGAVDLCFLANCSRFENLTRRYDDVVPAPADYYDNRYGD